MVELAEVIRTDLMGRARKSRGGHGYPQWLRDKVVTYYRERAKDGAGYATVGDELGISAGSVERWTKKATELVATSGESGTAIVAQPLARALVPVDVRPDTEERVRRVVLVSPRGYRVEHLSVDAAAALLRGLE